MESFDTHQWVSLSPWPGPVLVGLGLALALGVVLAGLSVRREPSLRRRWLMWALRVAAGVCALFFLLEPGVRTLQVARVKNRVAVLVDQSASMSFPSSPEGPSRSALVARAFETWAPQMNELQERYSFELLGFSPELAPLDVKALHDAAPRGARTDFLSTLRSLMAQDQGGARKLAGVILLSDGADNGELAQGVAGKSLQMLEQLQVPVTTVAVGQGGLRDLSIESIKADDFAFVRNSIAVEADVVGRGFAGQSVQAVLKREGQVVGTATVQFTGAEERKTVKFTLTPDQTGRFVYTVSVPVFPDEVVAENNVSSFALKVIRDRVRVLLVAGRPTWDERFLRGVLKQDANVELISFYILRNQTDQSGVIDDQRELSLIPFPREEIFQKKLGTFDVVVVLNFGNEDQQISLQSFRGDLERYVQNGGGFAYLGGDVSFGEAKSSNSPFEGVLPVSTAGQALLTPFVAQLTPAGLRHPVTLLGGAGQSSESAWAALPPVAGMNLTRPKPGATVLLSHPTALVDGTLAPLVTVQEIGRGRSLAIASDATWYWAFPSHASGAPTRNYERFWNNAVRWLVRDPELTTVSVAVERPTVEPGKVVGVEVVARQADYQAAPKAQVVVELVSAEDGRVVAQQRGESDAEGRAHLEFPPPRPGAYKIVGRATKDEQPLGENADAFAVRATGPELADARVNAGLLAEMAKVTGGAFFESPEFSLSQVPLREPPLVEVGRSQDKPLWDRWYWLTLLVVVLGFEWAVRRRFGYV